MDQLRLSQCSLKPLSFDPVALPAVVGIPFFSMNSVDLNAPNNASHGADQLKTGYRC